MLDNLRADTRRLKVWKTRKAPWYVLESLLFENGYQAVILHRIAHWFKSRRVPFFGPLFARLSLFLTGVDISPGAQIGPGLLISHGVGLVIGGNAKIGANALILHQVTIGSPSVGRLGEMPRVGDDVFIGAGATLIGDIQVGDGALIDAMVLVSRDVPAGHRVAHRGASEILPLEAPEPSTAPPALPASSEES